MAGNVWQWTTDWYRPDYYRQLAATGGARNPRGPDSSLDPSEPNQPKKVHRGGSYLCTYQYCSRYVVGTRGKGDPSTGTNHLGFRCVMTREEYEARPAKTSLMEKASRVSGSQRRNANLVLTARTADVSSRKRIKTYIASGGGIDFMRPWAEQVYGVPSDQLSAARSS